MANLALAFDILARDHASKTFDKVGDSAQSAGKRGSLMGTAIKTGLALAGTALVGAGVGAVGFGLKVAASNEQAQIAFTTMLGSAQKAKTFLGQLQAFAAKTPFEFPELQTAASSLISVGISADKVIPIMTSLGNATSGMGTGAEGVQRATVALQQMNAAGRISAEDLNQLRDAGIPVYDLLTKATGKTTAQIAQMAQTGKLGRKELDQMMSALASGKGLERFNGLMDKQSASLSGLVSTFKDTLGQGLANALTPLIPLIKDGLGAASTFLGVALQGVAKGLSFLVSGFQAVRPYITAAMDTVKLFIGTLTGQGADVEVPWMNATIDAAGTIAGIFTNQLVPAFRTVWQALSDFISGFTVGTDAVGSAQSTFAVFGATLYSTLIPAFQAVWSFITTRVVPAVMGIVSAIRGFIAVALPIVQQFVAGMMARIGPMMPQIRAIFGQIGSIIVSVMGLIQAIIQRVTAIIGGIWSRWGTQIMNFAAAVFRTILAVISGALNIIAGVVRTVTALIHGDWSGAWDGIKQIVSGAVQVIQAVVSGAMSLLRTIMSAAWSGIRAGASAAWGGIKSAVSTGASDVVSFIGGLPGQFVSALGDLGGLLLGAGQALIQGLIDGITSKIRAVTDAASSIASTIRGFFPGSPVKTGPLTSWNNGGAGRRLGDMLAAGLDASIASVSASSRNLAAAVVSPVGSVSAGDYGTLGAGGPLVHIEHMTVRDEEEAARRIEARQRDAMAVYNLVGA